MDVNLEVNNNNNNNNHSLQAIPFGIGNRASPSGEAESRTIILSIFGVR
jgi:hypothetical protein